MRKSSDPSEYKTEEMLKAEARQRAAEQARLDASKKPVSPGKKRAENYWYHYKWHTLAALAVALLAAFFLKDVLFQVKPDATITLATATAMMPDALEALQAELEAVAGDYNGDGRVKILIDYIHLPTAAGAQPGGGMDYASAMKLTAVVVTGSDPLFLLDDTLYAYLTATESGEAAQHLFAPLDGIGAAAGEERDRLPVSATVLAANPDCAPLADHAFSLRPLPGEGNEAYRAYCLDLLEALTAYIA